MKKDKIIRITLLVDYTEKGQQLNEIRTMYSVTKHTGNRFYVKENNNDINYSSMKYLLKDHFSVVQGQLSAVGKDINPCITGELSVYGWKEDCELLSTMLREEFIKKSTKLNCIMSDFHAEFAHDDILKKDWCQVKITERNNI